MTMASAQASSDLPSLGDSSSRLVSPQMEQQIGQMFLKQLHATLPISKDVLIQYYVEQHMWALAQYSDLQSALNTVIVVDNQSINAFAAPGGIIGINLGLLIYAQDSDEYSSVMRTVRNSLAISVAMRCKLNDMLCSGNVMSVESSLVL